MQLVTSNNESRMIAPKLVFPLIMTAGLLTTQQLMTQQVAPALAALIAVLLFGFLAVPILERLMPYRSDWNRNEGDLGPDLIYMLSNAAIPKLWTPVQVFVLVGLTTWLTQQTGSRLWPEHWHWLPALFLMLLIAEFGRYWVHFAAHKIPWLWRLHAVHHSPKRLYWLNANRFHPLEKLLFQIPEVAPFVLLGTPEEIIALYFTFNGLHGLLQHSNIRIQCGPLNWLFSMTELHRWHHSKKIEESDRNFGNNLIVWDILFGTYYNPRDMEVEAIGLLNQSYPKSWFGMLKAPFAGRDLSKPKGYQCQTKVATNPQSD